MTREVFWDTLDAAMSAAAFDRAALAGALRDELLELGEDDDVVDFARHFHDCRVEAFRWEVWAAAWVAGGGASEEDFSDFRDWLITLGRAAFDDVLHDPERLPDHADPAELRHPYDAEVGHVAFDVYVERTGEDQLPPERFRPHPREPAGRRWKAEQLAVRYPKLWAFYNR